MATAVTARLSGRFLWLLIFAFSSSFTIISSDEVSLVVDQPSALQLSSGLQVKNSPGSKPGALVVCERVCIHGLSRIKHLGKFAHSVKVKVKVVQTSSRVRLQNIEVCIHRNKSLRIGMCPQHWWQKHWWKKLVKDYWIHLMSPYDHMLLDIRTTGPSLDMLEVSIEEEFVLYRVIFLVLGIVMMTLGSFLSQSIVFYYSSSMAVGVIHVILMVLFQVGVGSFFLRYVPCLFQSILVALGISEDMYKPLVIFLLVFFVLAGAWLGFWIVCKLILTEDGSVDTNIAHFVACSIRILATVMILQSSLDSILAAEALLAGILISYIMRRIAKLRFFRHLYKCTSVIPKHFNAFTSPGLASIHALRPRYAILSVTECGYLRSGHFFRTVKSNRRRSNIQDSPFQDSRDEYLCKMQRRGEEFELLRSQTKPFTLSSCNSPVRGLSKTPPYQPSDSETFYSTFHNTPERKNFSKDKWERFTRDSTKTA